MEAVLRHSSEIYAVEYFGFVILLTLLECVAPRRPAGDALRQRWAGNIAIAIVDTILIRLLFPLVGIGWAAFCAAQGWGLFNQFASPPWATVIITLVTVDLAVYAQHYAFHRVPALWRVHRVHHTDPEYDFTTGVRFHPLEGVASTTVLLCVTLALGAPPLAVFVWQMLSVGVSFIEHANLRIPSSLDRILRIVVVTPDMHRIHHSQHVGESQSNFSNTFSWWDRFFGTYADQPARGHDGIVFGLADFSDRKYLSLRWMLMQPFMRAETQPERIDSAMAEDGPSVSPSQREPEKQFS